jgi:hypothetical protein
VPSGVESGPMFACTSSACRDSMKDLDITTKDSLASACSDASVPPTLIAQSVSLFLLR